MDIVHVPAYPFVRIFNDNLYPFGANVPKADGTFPVGSEVWTHPAVINKIEPGSMFVLGDRSGGDLDGQNDKFIFATYNAQATGLSESWTAEIASASNLSVHSYSKGMIMARESLAPNSRYFAVGRTGDAHGLVVLYRDHDNNGTGYHEYDSSRYKENWAFVKLELIPYVVNGQNHTLCRGYGSHTGIDGTWGQIGQDIDIEGTLPFRGLAVSSNSGYDFGRIHIPILNYDNGYLTLFHFVNLRRSVNGGAADLLDLNQFQPQGINGATDAFVQRLYQPSLSCRNLMFDSDPNVCGAQVDLPPALFGHCGTATFNPPAGSIFPVGTTTVTATTPGGANCTFTVTVRDAQEPTVTSFVSRPMLSKLDNDLVIVGFTANATDNCSGVSPVQVSVFSDEDDAVGSNFAPDARDIGVGALRLRAERDSSADGRVYLIVVTATDAQGNVGFSCTTVVVPKDQSQASIDSVNAQAAAARAYCTANNGASPPGFFVVGDGPVIGPKQ